MSAQIEQIAFVLPTGRKERRAACRAMAKLWRHRIIELTNGNFAVSVWFSDEDEVRLIAETRAELGHCLDEFFKLLANPKSAIALHRELARLRERREANALKRAGIIIMPDGRIENIDAAGEA
jgi:hypothetical protein